MLPLTSGEVIIGGSKVTEPSGKTGIVFQEPALMPWRNTLANILLPAEIVDIDRQTATKRAHELIELVGLEDFEQNYPHELSGGMQQRATLCRALIHNPSLLLLDEPFGSLDAMTREQLNLEFLKLLEYQKSTTIFVTHSITEAIFLADRVIVMGPRPGTIVGEIPIHFPRPRASTIRDSEEFIALSRRIRGLIIITKKPRTKHESI